MLEITNLRDGQFINHHHGVETDDYLEIAVQGIADPQADVTVNGIPAERIDRNFSVNIRLTENVNKITACASDHFGERTLTITVFLDKKSFKRYNFFFDDCSFFLRSIAIERPASIFDEMFLGRLKSIHDRYGTLFTLNLFYHDDHHDFCIADMPEDYKDEFKANSDWLKMSFHAYSEFPDRPYQNAAAEKLAADYDLIYNEVCRFAGKDSFIAPCVIHWAMTNPDNFGVLKERGVKCLAGGYIGSKVSVNEKQKNIQVTDIGFHYEKDVAIYIRNKHIFYDRFHDIFLLDDICCCNYDDIESIRKKFAAIPEDQEVLNLMSHEQYSYPDYFNYIPDHLDRVEEACHLATEKGFKPVWLSQGILGK